MPPIDAPTWWADVQLDREELGGRRQPESWLDEEVDFTPRKRFPRRERELAPLHAPGAEDLHGVFVHAESEPVVDTTATEIVLERAPAAAPRALPVDELVPEAAPAHDAWRSWGDVAEPPAPGERRTVHISGRPEARMLPAASRRNRPRTVSDRFGHRPDRIVLWAAVLGAILILLAITSSDSHAATHAVTQLPR